MKRTFVIIIVAIALIFIIRCFWSASQIFSSYSNNSKLDSVVTSQKVPDEYLKLFKDRDKLILDVSKDSKRRNAISEFYYNQKFLIQVYKLDTINKLSVSKIIDESFKDAPMSLDVEFSEDLNNTEFEIGYKEGLKEKVSHVYLTLYGDSTQVIKKNDTVAYYYSKFEDFSIKYAIGAPEDIYAHTKDEFKGYRTPLELLFLKRNNNLYFILLGAENDHTLLDKDMLYNLIIGNNL